MECLSEKVLQPRSLFNDTSEIKINKSYKISDSQINQQEDISSIMDNNQKLQSELKEKHLMMEVSI